MLLKLDYYYGKESEQYSFYRIPKLLFTDKRFAGISVEAKVLYGLLLDRMGLSIKNDWLDSEGRVYIIFTIADIMATLGCAEQKANKLLSELDSAKGIGLIERKRRGLCKPNVIYVKNFVGESPKREAPEREPSESGASASQIRNCENHKSGDVNITDQELRNSQGNDTEKNHTDVSETDPSIYPSGTTAATGTDGSIETLRRQIREQIDYEILCQRHPFDTERLDGFVELMIEVHTSRRPFLRINGEGVPVELVKERLLKLDSGHIEYVMKCLDENTASIGNIRSYMLSALFNAPVTISQYYASQYNHDAASGFYDDPDSG